jgi:hypothetical protein
LQHENYADAFSDYSIRKGYKLWKTGDLNLKGALEKTGEKN